MKKFVSGVVAGLLLLAAVAYSNDFFNASGTPATGSQASSASMRAEFSSIATGFDKLPTLTGNGSEFVTINSGGTAMTSLTAAEVRTALNITGLFQPLDADLTAIAGLTSAADKGIMFTGSGTAATFTLTAAGLALLDDVDAAAQRTTLGLGTIATQAANNVTITGGTINGNTIGGSSAAAGTFTTLTATSIAGDVRATQEDVDAGTSDSVVMTPAVNRRIVDVGAVQGVGQTAIEFTSAIPVGARRFSLRFNGVSTNGTANLLIQIGDGASYITTGYVGAVTLLPSTTTANFSSGALINGSSAANVYHGTVTFSGGYPLALFGGASEWAVTGALGLSSSANTFVLAGGILDSGQVTSVRVTTVGGTNTFDAGQVYLSYER